MVNLPFLAGTLIEQLRTASYECMVCCDNIRCEAAVWSCSNCYNVFHLRCVKKWAKSPAAAVENRDGEYLLNIPKTQILFA